MSSSSGLNLTPETMLKLYQPEIILWLFSKTEPTKAFDFCFDDGILRQYFEFDKMYNEVEQNTAGDYTRTIMYYSEVKGRKIDTVPMSHLVQFGSIVNFNIPMLETVFEKIGTPYKYEQFIDRIDRAKFWLEQCSPESVNTLRKTRNFAFYDTLSETEKKEISLLADYLKADGYSLDDLNTKLYAIPKTVHGADLSDKELKTVQGSFFKNVYKLLIDREKGPRLYLFLFAVNKEDYLPLLDFSTPQSDAEKEIEAAALAAETEEVAPAEPVSAEPDPFLPIKPEATIEDFGKIDLRVCKIIKAAEIRKSHSCLKLTLDDGSGEERVIVSSIKKDYTPEELIGRKIIVFANLKPARLTGVTSNGMLIAATNSACGCKLIFVDDSVPTGTPVK